MTREDFVNSSAYHITGAAIDWWRKHNNDKDIGLDDAFEAGAEWMQGYMIDKACAWLEEHYSDLFMDSRPTSLAISDYIDKFKKAIKEVRNE